MITKPEEAVPQHMIFSETTDAAQVGGVKLRGGDGFTADECAQIAVAFAKASVQFSSNTMWDFGAKEIYGAEVNAWRKRFAEWEGK